MCDKLVSCMAALGDSISTSRREYDVVKILCNAAGTFVGDVAALARISFGIDMGRNVAMKLVTRSEAPDVSEAIHQIIQS